MKILAGIAIALSGFAGSLAAQVHLETGGGQGRLDQLSSSSLTALGGGFGANVGASRLELSGDAQERFGLGSTGLASGHWFYRLATAGWQIDAGPEAQAARDIAAPWASTFSGHIAAVREFGPFSLRAEWQQGVAQIGDKSGGWHRPTLGADFHAGAWQAGTTWQTTAIADTGNSPGSSVTSDSQPPSPRGGRDIQEISAHAGWRAGLLSISGRVGRRFGLSVLPETWWESQVALRLTPVMSLTARTGRLASDVLLDLRGGQYTTVGLRLDLLQPAHASGRPETSRATQVERETSEVVHLWFALPARTRQASLSSDLTDWQPVILARGQDGRWEALLHAKAGVYRVNISVDNGQWQAPAGLPATDDGFGNKVGLLVVEQ